MKCKYCNGTGEHINDANRMTTCEFCGGTGKFDPNEVDRFNAVDFIKVMEMVKKPLTNEEWLEQASTEEKAKLLSKLCKFIYNCGEKGIIPKIMYEEDFVQWLKEKHE